MMLSAQHLQLVADTLDDSINTLDAITCNFRQAVPNKADYFGVCSAFHLLLNDDLMVSPLQKIVAYYLLSVLYPSHLENNPFLPAFLNVFENPNAEPWEFNYCASFLKGPVKEIAGKTPQEAYVWATTLPTPDIDTAALCTAFEASMRLPDPYSGVGVSNTLHINDPSQVSADSAEERLRERIQMNDFTMDTLKPFFLRPRPPILEPSREEALWINPSIPLAPGASVSSQSIWFEWDATMGRLPPNEQSEAIELLNAAFAGPLSREQMTKLITELRASPEILRDSNFTPQALGQLVELNPKVAIQALVELVQCIGPDLTLTSSTSYSLVEYWMVLVNIPTSKHSMEVISQICSAVELPTEYLHLYISNCFATCRQTQDPLSQNRLVAMCCVFLTTLIRNKILNVGDIFVELEAFCISYSKVPGASTLYRLLKQMQ
jgi:hypothetical protein